MLRFVVYLDLKRNGRGMECPDLLLVAPEVLAAWAVRRVAALAAGKVAAAPPGVAARLPLRPRVRLVRRRKVCAEEGGELYGFGTNETGEKRGKKRGKGTKRLMAIDCPAIGRSDPLPTFFFFTPHYFLF